MALRAVIFDLGGVVLGSPLHAIAEYERELGIEAGLVNRVVVESGTDGAWSRLERGELDIEGFAPAFEAECAAVGGPIDARAMLERMARAARPRPEMLAAIEAIRARGLRTAALTNNWASDERDDGSRALRPHFDAYFESSVLGWRKPDPRIYRHACEALGVAPSDAAFLDDIGRNLKTARELGMATIKVEEPARALAELEALLGFSLDPGERSPPQGKTSVSGY